MSSATTANIYVVRQCCATAMTLMSATSSNTLSDYGCDNFAGSAIVAELTYINALPSAKV